jgi:glycerol-3-phosphate acyltransferase PlsX
MRIAIDAMGGDNAPDEIIAGAIESISKLEAGDELILVGPEQLISAKLRELRAPAAGITVADAPDVIAMDEPPIDSLRKKPRSSIGVLAKLVKHDRADAAISAGNTGACVAAFQMRMRNLEGVNRPGIAVVFPTFEGPVVICDVGANIACKPINLYQYAVMAGMYSKYLLGIENPRAGLLSIGEEEAKGNEIVKKAKDLIRADKKMNFVGNIEGRDIFRGRCDVAVCDGFVGNVVLKLTEGLVEGLFKPVMMRIYQKYDYNEYGGAPLLGVNGTGIICHGASTARTIRNAIVRSKEYHRNKINDKIIDYLAKSSVRAADEQGS